MSEVRVVDLKELGVSKEVFDKIYSMGEQDGRTDREKEIYIKVNDEFWHRDSYEQGYEQGKADAINEVIRLINSKHATIQYSEQTDIHTTTIYQRDTNWLKEQLKEKKNK